MTRQVGHYRVISNLGEGGMGAVYRATDTKLGREVAIKVLPDAVANDPERLARFTREAQALAALNHPNIAQIYGVEESGDGRALVPPENASFADDTPPALTPDGRRLAFVALQQGRRQLWIRELDSVNARSLTGTEGATGPFWSPDGQSLGFTADGKLKRIDVSGGTIQTLCATEGNVYGASWSSRGVIVFPMSPTSGLFRVPASGGTPTPVSTLDRAAGEVSHRLVWFFPDGRHFLFSVRNLDQMTKSALYVGDLDSAQRTLVMQHVAHTAYVPGFLVFTPVPGYTNLEEVLMAQSFDASSFRTKGEPFAINDGVSHSSGVWAQYQFSASAGGTPVYDRSSQRVQLTWVNRSGKVLGSLGAPGNLRAVAISPDSSTVAIENTSAGVPDIWLQDVGRGTFSRFTFNSAGAGAISPAWAADGKSVYFGRYEAGGAATVMRRSLGGGEARPAGSPWGNRARAVLSIRCSPDGKYLIAWLNATSSTGNDLWLLPLNRPGEKPRPYLESSANERDPSFSASSDWLAYTSNETRRYEVYVQAFPQPGRKYQVSVNGGSTPVWSRDGKELFFIAPDRQMMAASIQKKGDGLEIGVPKALFDSHFIPDVNATFDVSKDGRFLIPMQEERGDVPLTLVVNWQAGLKR